MENNAMENTVYAVQVCKRHFAGHSSYVNAESLWILKWILKIPEVKRIRGVSCNALYKCMIGYLLFLSRFVHSFQ